MEHFLRTIMRGCSPALDWSLGRLIKFLENELRTMLVSCAPLTLVGKVRDLTTFYGWLVQTWY